MVKSSPRDFKDNSERFEKLVQAVVHSLNDLYAPSGHLDLSETDSQVIRDYCLKSREEAERLYNSLRKR